MGKDFDVISDVHTDFWCREYNHTTKKFTRVIKDYVKSLLPDNPANTLIISGDTGHRNEQDKVLLSELKTRYTNICVVAGNHDMYLISDSIGEKFNWSSQNRLDDMKYWCNNNDIHYLDGNTVCVDGIKISGLSMFWDNSHYKRLAGAEPSKAEMREYYLRTMNDLKCFGGGHKPYVLRTAYGGGHFVTDFNEYSFFAEQKAKLDAIESTDIMVSHYIPVIYNTMPEFYKDDLTTTFYTFDGEEAMDRLKPKAWVFGHTHVPVDEMYKGTRLICNPKGYPSERTNTKIKTFEV